MDSPEKITVGDGKYTFVLDYSGTIVDVLRYGEHWPAGFEMHRFSKSTLALIYAIAEARRQGRIEGLRDARNYAAVTYSAISNQNVREFCEWCTRRAKELEDSHD